MSDVIVIGAGIGGLSAALCLANRGAKVHVIEAARKPGGKASTERLHGVDVDTGPSVLTLPEVFDRLFLDAGTSLDAQVKLRTLTPSFRYVFADGTKVDLFHDVGACLDSVGRSLGSNARDELERFLQYAKKIWSAAAPHFVFAPAPSVSTLIRMGASGLVAFGQIDPGQTMEKAISKRIQSPYLRWILLRYATYNGSNPRTAPATLNCIAWVELGLGGFGIEGGIYALIEALEGVARSKGVQFSYDTPVRQIVVQKGAVVGVETDAGRLTASHVVANADVASVVTDLLPRTTRTGLPEHRSPSTSGYNAIVSRNARSGRLVAHSVAFPERYQEEFVDLFEHRRPPLDPAVYACAPIAAHGLKLDGVPEWKDKEPLFLMVNAPALPATCDPSTPAAHDRTIEARMLGRAKEAGFLDESASVLWRRTPSDLADRFPGSRGALYGAASNDHFAAFRRPPNRVARIKGLYLASGSAHPGGGLPLCALSGRHAADAVATALKLPAATGDSP